MGSGTTTKKRRRGSGRRTAFGTRQKSCESQERVMARTPAWQRKAGQNPRGGLNAAGRASYKPGDRRHTQASGQGQGGHTAEEAAQGQLLGKDGQRQGAVVQGWEEDQIEALTRGMGASW